MSGGWSPTVHLTSHLGVRPRWDEALAAFVPGDLPPGIAAAGAVSGAFTTARALADGAQAGASAAGDLGYATRLPNIPDIEPEPSRHRALWRVRGSRRKAFVDFQNDVAAGDVELAEREGFRAVEHLKRYTTLGMATDQGKTANVNGARPDGGADRQDHHRDRHHAFPPALYPRRHRRPRRASSRQGVPPGAPDADASMVRRSRRGVHRERAVDARAVLSARRRGRLGGGGEFGR